MSRIAALAAMVALSACATPPITLTPRYRLGEVRVYRIEARTDTSIDAAGVRAREETTLVARSRIEVAEQRADGVLVRVTLTPERQTVDGRETAAPSEQTAEIVIGPDGNVRDVTRVGGLPADVAGVDVEELVPLLGPRLPVGRVRVGRRWETSVDGGEEHGRVAGLRVVRGYDCAIVSLASTRPVERTRDVGGAPLTLAGVERAATEIAFAFRDGFPVEITRRAEARLSVGAATGGEIVIETETTIALEG